MYKLSSEMNDTELNCECNRLDYEKHYIVKKAFKDIYFSGF